MGRSHRLIIDFQHVRSDRTIRRTRAKQIRRALSASKQLNPHRRTSTTRADSTGIEQHTGCLLRQKSDQSNPDGHETLMLSEQDLEYTSQDKLHSMDDTGSEASDECSSEACGTMDEQWEALLDEFEEDLEVRLRDDSGACQSPLSPELKDMIALFSLVICGGLSRGTYDRMLRLLGHRLPTQSYHMLLEEVSKHAHVGLEVYDCCVNSCCAYTGELAALDCCPHCGNERFDKWNRSRQQFRYMPITPRLQSLFLNRKLAESMDYRQTYDHASPNISDVFDGEHYLSLLAKHVVIDGTTASHQFFSEGRDIALAYMTDGFQIFKRQRKGGATCWPMIAINFNLPPEVRVRLPNVLPLAIIPGPSAPKNFNSFQFPFVAECKKLARGVRTLDARHNETFMLHVYPISVIGDMQAIKHLQCFKAINSIVPCRTCEIQAIRDPSKPGNHYYTPLQHPDKATPGWDPANLPLRTDERINAQLAAIESAPTKASRSKLQMRFGINERSILSEVPSLSMLGSFPHEWMHLWLENHCKNLLDFWQGKYKKLDEGRESFRIPDSTWELIGRETASASATIPSGFARPTPNVWIERRNFTAEDYSFWFIHIAPQVLRNRFPRPKYYKHFMKLNRILKLTLEYSFTPEMIVALRRLVIEYVEEYEDIYYQYDIERLSACPLTVHALLHAADDIVKCGPPCMTWSFVMERWCLYLLSYGVKSRYRPYTTLAFHQFHAAQLNELQNRHGLVDLLGHLAPSSTPSSHEQVFLNSDYPLSILRSPHLPFFKPDASLRRKICNYFSMLFPAQKPAFFQRLLPITMPLWGKVRVANGGDKISSVLGQSGCHGTFRDASFIRYEMNVDRNARHKNAPIDFHRVVFYARLEQIIQCTVPADNRIRLSSPKLFLLALVTDCVTDGKDATANVVTFTIMKSGSHLIDLNAIQCVIGRFELGVSQRRWAIVDRSEDWARTVFTDTSVADDADGN